MSFRAWVPEPVKAAARQHLPWATKATARERRRLTAEPAYSHGVTTMVGEPALKYVHPMSFHNQAVAIFDQLIYDFDCPAPSPRIIDGGANVGLASIFWGSKWPAARITAFEADPSVADVLRWNLGVRGLHAVEVVEAALAASAGTLRFAAEGGDAGRLSADGAVEVKAVPLATFLSEPVDLLKLDIEGAETDVLTACADELRNVQRIFVEYHSLADSRQQLGDLHDVLQQAGFRMYIESEFVPTRPFHEVTTSYGMDSQLNIWATRPDLYAGR